MAYGMKNTAAKLGTGIKSAEPIVNHIYSGKTSNVMKPMQAPDSLVKGSSNMGGTAPTSRVFNEMK